MRAILAAFLPILLCPLAEAQTADEIMKSVRQVAVFQEVQNLHGHIRKGSKRTPLSLFFQGKDIQFALNGGKERFHLRLDEDEQILQEFIGKKWRPFPDRKISAPIAGTDASYEDLALMFLYWPNARIVGEETISRMPCWRIHLDNPKKTGRYREVSVWVAKKNRALTRIVGYGVRPKGGQPPALKEFIISDVMKVNKVWTVKKMRISTYGKSGRVSGNTYIEFKKP